ncbi:MAG: tetratricopeptide repeat protein [Proteobacteria bacterium]|nr:tetratricopeptide repeat protein [Pseudomonadota bacterium]MBU4297395.1 tetratricopeptide repeat protein [Pseudomonadota bacterium]MCG2748739.1 tetratricopeptide repeat protein [Desulfobulbaceae bacterium]
MLFFLGNSSCSGGSQGTGNSLKAADSVTAETNDEPADAACSYFYFLWGKSAEDEQKYEEAMEAYEKALVCDPQAVYVDQKLAVLLFNMGKKEQAIVQLEKMIAEDPANIQNRLLLANIYSSMGQNDQARAVYEAILKIAPDDPHTLLMLGALYASDRDYQQAQKILERLVTVDDKSYAGYSYLAKLYRELNYYDKAMEAYEKALALNWSPMLAYEAADLYEYRQKYDEAAAIYKRLLEDDEANTKIRGRLARLYIVQGKIDEALAELQELKNYSSDTGVVDLAIGRVLLDEKRYPEAISLFEKMLEQKENKDVARTMLALTYYESGDKDKAKKMLQEVPVTSKDYEESILMLAQILIGEKDNQRAVTLLRNVIAGEDTRRPSFYFLLASLLREEGDPDGGSKVFDQAVQAFPENSKVFFEYGLYLDRLGKPDEAVAKMEQVLAMTPEDAYALNYVGYTWADRGINLEKALEYIKRAVDLKPDDGFVRDSLGWVFFKMARYGEAVKELEAAAGMQPDDPTIQEHLGDAYQKDGQMQKAVEAYGKAVSLYTDDMKKAHALAEMKALQNSDKKD